MCIFTMLDTALAYEAPSAESVKMHLPDSSSNPLHTSSALIHVRTFVASGNIAAFASAGSVLNSPAGIEHAGWKHLESVGLETSGPHALRILSEAICHTSPFLTQVYLARLVRSCIRLLRAVAVRADTRPPRIGSALKQGRAVPGAGGTPSWARKTAPKKLFENVSS